MQSTPDFRPDLEYCNFLIDIGFGKNCNSETREFWQKTIQANYTGDDGRRRARMAAINLRERDGLHGTDDTMYSVSNAEEEIEPFKNAKSKKLITSRMDSTSSLQVIRRLWTRL